MDLMDRRRLMEAQTFGPIEPASDGKVWAYYDIVDTSSSTKLINTLNFASQMEIDGVSVTPTASYQFATAGEHLVKITINNRQDEDGAIFMNCPALSKIYFPQGKPGRLGNYMFYGCTSLVELVAPGAGLLKNTPLYNTALTRVSFPSATSISDTTLSNTVIAELELGPNLTAISSAFRNNTHLLTLRVLAVTPPSTGNSPFLNNSVTTVYVPAEAVSAYQTASGWSSVSTRIQAIQ